MRLSLSKPLTDDTVIAIMRRGCGTISRFGVLPMFATTLIVITTSTAPSALFSHLDSRAMMTVMARQRMPR